MVLYGDVGQVPTPKRLFASVIGEQQREWRGEQVRKDKWEEYALKVVQVHSQVNSDYFFFRRKTFCMTLIVLIILSPEL